MPDRITACALLVHMTRHRTRRLDVDQGAAYLIMRQSSDTCIKARRVNLSMCSNLYENLNFLL